MATLNVPRKVRKSGEIRVKEIAAVVRARILLAERKKQGLIILTETNGRILAIKHSLINSVSE